MRAKLKSLWSPDIEDLASFKPDDPNNFSIHVQMLVGPADTESEESFEVTVCTPQSFYQYGTEEVLLLRHYVVVFEYNYERLLSRLKSHIESCSGDTWQEIAQKIARVAQWEFEDYRPYQGK